MNLRLRESSFKGIQGGEKIEFESNCELIETTNDKLDRIKLENAKANEECKSYFVE